MLTVTYVKDIFAKTHESWLEPAGREVGRYVPRGWSPALGLVERNGQRIKNLEQTTRPGDHVVFLTAPDETFFWILTVLSVALTFASLGMSLAMAGSGVPKRRKERDIYQWEGVQTTIGPGAPIPFILGTVRAGGHVIQSYISPQYYIRPSSSWGKTQEVERDEEAVLQSNALNTQIAYCWGPIESISDIEIDGNAIENYGGVEYDVALGTVYQGAPADFSGLIDDQSVSSGEITYGNNATATTAQFVDAVAVEISFYEGLYRVSSSGKLRQREVEILFKYSTDGGTSYTDYGTFTFSGAMQGRSPYWVRFPNLGRNRYTIYAERVTADSTDPAIKDKFEFRTLKSLIFGYYAHPGIANVGYRQIPQQYAAMPQRYTAVIKGCNDIRVYTTTTAYTETWTDNPVWCALYWICNPLFGLGRFYSYGTCTEDMQEWIDAAAWCDEVVEDGAGGYEKRYTFNHEFKEAQPAKDILSMFSESCGIYLVEQAGKWRVIPQDDDEMVAVFTEGSYVKDSLTWGFVGTHERATRLSGTFFNAEQEYESDTAMVSRLDLPLSEPNIDDSLDLRGTTNIRQAVRRLKQRLNWIQLSNRYCSFVAGYSALALRAGDIFGLATLTGAAGLANGRLVRASTDRQTLWLDSEVELSTGSTYEITVGHHESGQISQVSFTVAESQTTSRIVVSDLTSWNGAPMPGDVYSVGLLNYSVQKFRCTSKRFRDDLTCEIQAELHDPDIYAVEYAIEAEETADRYFDPAAMPEQVDDLEGNARQTKDSGGTNYRVDIDVSWTHSGLNNLFYIYYRVVGEDTWIFDGTTRGTTYIIRDLEGGLSYEVKVTVRGYMGTMRTLDDVDYVTVVA
jgi:predicted phage tail protein